MKYREIISLSLFKDFLSITLYTESLCELTVGLHLYRTQGLGNIYIGLLWLKLSVEVYGR
jgi:hypothetical protein